MPNSKLADWLAEEPFHLSLSSGFFSFFAHLGFISALEDENLLPSSIAGSSAGALIGGLWAAGLNMQQLQEAVFDLKKADFWDPGLGYGLLKGEKFRKLIRQLSPVSRIEDCVIPLALSVYNIHSKTSEVKRQGELADILYASCAVPVLFHPIRLNGQLYADGGIKDRPALASVKQGERVLHHHISSRSPWRRKSDPALKAPERENQVSVSLLNLPRSGPNKLQLGPAIYQQARRQTQAALKSPAKAIIAINNAGL